MGHHIQAIVGRCDVLQGLPGVTLPHRVVPLAQGFSLVPTTHELLDHLDAVHSSEGNRPRVDGFIHLGGGLVSLLRLLSKRAPVAYIETEYFGGAGTQSAAAYIDGEEVFAEGEVEAGHPINRALEMIGVHPTSSDEFDALGLVRFRNMGSFDDQGASRSPSKSQLSQPE